ncbi:hypothetical protein [Nocardia gipuzkoensis]
MRARRRIAVVLAGLVGVGLVGGCGTTSDPGAGPGSSTAAQIVPLISTNDLRPAQPDEVHLFGFNDLHGHLEPPADPPGRSPDTTRAVPPISPRI